MVRADLLVTSVVIDYPASAVAANASTVAVSTITLAELSYGLHTADPLLSNQADFTGIHDSLAIIAVR